MSEKQKAHFARKQLNLLKRELQMLKKFRDGGYWPAFRPRLPQ